MNPMATTLTSLSLFQEYRSMMTVQSSSTYEDELGRIRATRKPEVPRHLLPTYKDQEIGDKTSQGCGRGVGRGAEHPEMHYDAMKEVRTKGAAFHRFSTDEHQESADASTREETVKTRKELGMDPGSSGGRPLEKRKGEIENTGCALLYAKRKQLKTDGQGPPSEPKPIPRTPATLLSQATTTVDADTFSAQLEQEVLKKQK
ncbi:hypothetical protein EDC04DRAFT_2907423 [Pisolithus marmoratus]|nr:hypothetical protein EDC04DRAFT_2907423 [Pisolithus marmoratus]